MRRTTSAASRSAVKKSGMKLNEGFFGSVGKSYDRIKQVFKSGNLREKVQHVVNFSGMWAKQVFKKNADDVKKLLADAGVASSPPPRTAAARAHSAPSAFRSRAGRCRVQCRGPRRPNSRGHSGKCTPRGP